MHALYQHSQLPILPYIVPIVTFFYRKTAYYPPSVIIYYYKKVTYRPIW